MKQKGFTLIELMAVIGILAIIALITAPIVLNVIKDSKKNAFVDSAEGLSISARNHQVKNGGNAVTVTFSNGVSNPALKVSGVQPDAGKIIVNDAGKIVYALWNNDVKKCVVKTIGDKKGKIIDSVTTSANCTNYGITDATVPVITEVYTGGMKNTDPNFSSGNNGTVVYNNTGNGLVKNARVLMGTGYGNYALQITTSGAATPGLGGFYFGTPTAANKILTTKIIAKIPVGYNITWASNAIGTGGSSGWLTDVKGTGEWKEYVYRVTSGSTGTFSSTNFYYLTGAAATAAKPVTWNVAYATVYTNTDYGKAGVTFKATDTGSGIVGYGISKSNTEEPSYTVVSKTTSLGAIIENITANGVYYIWVKDESGNKATKAVTVSNAS